MGTKPAPWTNLDQVTICVLILRNGTKIVGVNEGPVARENFSAETGRKYAREAAVEQIWPLLGYQLRTKLAAESEDFPLGKACDLSGEGPCEGCQ